MRQIIADFHKFIEQNRVDQVVRLLDEAASYSFSFGGGRARGGGGVVGRMSSILRRPTAGRRSLLTESASSRGASTSMSSMSSSSSSSTGSKQLLEAKDEFGWSPVMKAAAYGADETLEMLIQRGANVNEVRVDEGRNEIVR